MIVTGYQTLEDRDNIDHVETVGPFPCSRGDAWLSNGCYLWDTNMKWAIEWGQNSFGKKGKEFIIATCGIDLSKKCFDLFGSVADKVEFMKIVEVFKQSGKLKPHHRVIVANIIRFMENKNIFPYKSIRAADYPSEQKKYYYSVNNERGEYSIMNQRVQVCVKHKKGVILPPFRVIFPDKYNDQL
ncbi:MAG TPA: hypothetical protein PKV02_00260 [Bacteroidia bacterium]|nr:hypothetical protein [Bacteroidia bacterium]